LKDVTAAEPSSEQTVRGVNRVAGVSRGHIKPVETSRANRKVRRTHPGEGPNGGPSRMVGINERGSRRYVLMIIMQQCAEEFIASCLSESPTGQIRLMEPILERNNMRRAVSV